MSRQLGSGEYEVTIKVRMTRLMKDTIYEEAKAQGITGASIIRRCIEDELDPERRLELMLKSRSTPLERLLPQIWPNLDAGEQDQYDEMCRGTEDESILLKWLNDKLKALDNPE